MSDHSDCICRSRRQDDPDGAGLGDAPHDARPPGPCGATAPEPRCHIRMWTRTEATAMKRNTFKMSLLATSLRAAFGMARADTVTSVSSDRLEPKCMDTANTTPAGCVPSVPLTQSSSTTTTDITTPGVAVVPEAANRAFPAASGSSSSSTDVNISPGSTSTPSSSSSSTNLNVTPGSTSAPSSSSSSTSLNLNGSSQAPASSSSSLNLNGGTSSSSSPSTSSSSSTDINAGKSSTSPSASSS